MKYSLYKLKSNLNVKCEVALSPPVTVVIELILTMRSIRLKVLNCDVFLSVHVIIFQFVLRFYMHVGYFCEYKVNFIRLFLITYLFRQYMLL